MTGVAVGGLKKNETQGQRGRPAAQNGQVCGGQYGPAGGLEGHIEFGPVPPILSHSDAAALAHTHAAAHIVPAAESLALVNARYFAHCSRSRSASGAYLLGREHVGRIGPPESRLQVRQLR